MKKGDIIELEIDKYAFEGKGLTRVNKSVIKPGQEGENNYVVFVEGAYPGDKVKARLKKIKKSYAESKLEKLLLPSGLRVEPRCKFFGTCGGCKQQDLDYNAQLKYKQEQVKEIFEKMGSFTDFEFENILPSKEIYFYRNKMEFSFSQLRWLTQEEIENEGEIDREFALGLHVPRVYNKVLDIDECSLQSETSNKILNFTRSFFKSRRTPVYSTDTHKGFLRNIVIRQSAHTDDLMVNLVTSAEDDLLLKEYTDELLKEIPAITTVINNINLKKAAIAVGDYEKIYYGPGFIYDYIGKSKFRISANSFFQTNTLQAENLYKTALEFAGFKGDEIVYDLYSGAGTISIYISDKVKKVYGFENVESAVKDAGENRELNNAGNTFFVNADLYKSFLPEIEKSDIQLPDVVILDPPRGGMHPTTVDDVLNLNPEKIVYVSCNPTTQVRDIKLLTEKNYKLVKIKPVDMFPHTYHIENVALLIRK